MSGLKGMFGDEFSDLSASLRGAAEFDELSAVRSVRRRRTTRSMTVAAGGVLAVAAVGVGALTWGGGGHGEPATSMSPSPTPSASPSEAVDAAPTLDDARPGWFLLAAYVEGSESRVSALAPDGTVIEVGSLEDVGATSVLAWHSGEVVVFDQEATAASFYPVGTVSRTDVTWRLPTEAYPTNESGEWVGMLSDDRAVVGRFGGEGSTYSAVDDLGNESELCDGWALPSAQAVSPDGSQVMCFAWADGGRGTDVVVASASGKVRTVAHLTRDWTEYSYAGWLDTATALISRTDESGTALYFALSLDSGEVEEVETGLPSSAQVAVFSPEAGVYVRQELGAIAFYDASDGLVYQVANDNVDPAEGATVRIASSGTVFAFVVPAESGVDEDVWVVDFGLDDPIAVSVAGGSGTAATIDVIPFHVAGR